MDPPEQQSCSQSTNSLELPKQFGITHHAIQEMNLKAWLQSDAPQKIWLIIAKQLPFS